MEVLFLISTLFPTKCHFGWHSNPGWFWVIGWFYTAQSFSCLSQLIQTLFNNNFFCKTTLRVGLKNLGPNLCLRTNCDFRVYVYITLKTGSHFYLTGEILVFLHPDALALILYTHRFNYFRGQKFSRGETFASRKFRVLFPFFAKAYSFRNYQIYRTIPETGKCLVPKNTFYYAYSVDTSTSSPRLFSFLYEVYTFALLQLANSKNYVVVKLGPMKNAISCSLKK